MALSPGNIIIKEERLSKSPSPVPVACGAPTSTIKEEPMDSGQLMNRVPPVAFALNPRLFEQEQAENNRKQRLFQANNPLFAYPNLMYPNNANLGGTDIRHNSSSGQSTNQVPVLCGPISYSVVQERMAIDNKLTELYPGAKRVYTQFYPDGSPIQQFDKPRNIRRRSPFFNQLLRKFVSNPRVHPKAKDHFTRFGKIHRGKLAITKTLKNSEGGVWSLVTYADTVVSGVNGGTQRNGVRTCGRVMSCRKIDDYTYELLLAVDLTFKELATIVISAKDWEDKWDAIVVVGKPIEVCGNIFTGPNDKVIIEAKALFKANEEPIPIDPGCVI